MNKERQSKRGRKPKTKQPEQDQNKQGSRGRKPRGRKPASLVKSRETHEKESQDSSINHSEGEEVYVSNRAKSLEDQAEHYQTEFLDSPKYSYITMNIRNPPNKHQLMEIYNAVTEKGGFKSVTANCQWTDVQEELQISYTTNVFELYKKYLFHYEKIFNKETALKLNYKNDGVTIEDLDPNYLVPIKVFEISSPDDLTQEVIDQALKEDICVIRNFERATRFNKELFNPNNFIKEHPNDKIDIVTQDPEVKTFHRTKNDKEPMRLIDYLKYQKQEVVRDENGYIKFGVNIDIGEWSEQIDELVAKVPEEFLFCSLKDSLQYVRNHVLGMTQPQIYIKVKGSWTGGHEENLRYRAININHGPASSEWNCVGASNSAKLREVVRDTYKTDIYKKEGLWFADVDLCLAKKIPVVSFNQRKGDLVLIGPGCEHWVRGFGKAVQSAWNFGTFDKWQIQESFKRLEVNQNITYRVIYYLLTSYSLSCPTGPSCLTCSTMS
jgi:histone demethylase